MGEGPMKSYAHNGLAGCVQQRRCRASETMIGIYHGEQSGMEDDPSIPWVTVCEDHGSICCHGTLDLARLHAASPEWCGECILFEDAGTAPHHENNFRHDLQDGTWWSLYRLINRQWFLTRYESAPTSTEPGAVCMLDETIAPTPFKFTRRDGVVVDHSHVPDSTKWKARRAMAWAREQIRERGEI